MKKINILAWGVVLFITLHACNKKDNSNNDNTPLVFTSLVAENDTITLSGSTSITATATGSNLTYNWSVAKGNIVGSGYQIVYAATPCSVGQNEIICTVKDGNNNSSERSVTVTVIPY